jgi:hypothetical protein
MNNSITKKNKFKNISKLLIAILYGYFIVYNLNLDLAKNSGDIGQLIRNINVKINDPNLTTEYLFYYLINLIITYTIVDYNNIFQLIAFIISATLFYAFISHVKSENYSHYSFLLILIVFCTPRVFDLFASGVRSGLAFTILFFGLTYLKGISKIIAFIISVALHISMLPIIGLYYLFIYLKRIRLNLSNSIYLIILFFYGLCGIFSSEQFYSITDVAQSLFYQVLILILASLFILLGKEAVKNIYVFISIGIIFIVLIGFIFDVSFIRYVGNSILLYLFFLIEKNNKREIKIFFLSYFPFFALTLLYSILGILR